MTFSPDSKLLASGSRDTTVLLWDLHLATGGPSTAPPLSAQGLERLWSDLASDDGTQAYRAIRILIAAPKKSVPLLRERLQPATRPDPRRLAQRIAERDAGQFAVRDKAMRELKQLGLPAKPALEQALHGKPSLELRLRIESLLRIPQELLRTPEELRVWRSLEVLEQIDTPESRQVLEVQATGAPGVLITEEARAALRRLRRGSS